MPRHEVGLHGQPELNLKRPAVRNALSKGSDSFEFVLKETENEDSDEL